MEFTPGKAVKSSLGEQISEFGILGNHFIFEGLNTRGKGLYRQGTFETVTFPDLGFGVKEVQGSGGVGFRF